MENTGVLIGRVRIKKGVQSKELVLRITGLGNGELGIRYS